MTSPTPIPDWQLPPGVDRGLWDYLHSNEMVGGYDAHMALSPLAAADISYCESHFPTPGSLVDLGCGTGRLTQHFARRGFSCLGVDLSEEMLAAARANPVPNAEYLQANLVDLAPLPDAAFDYAACLFSTLGMIRGADNRTAALQSAYRVLKPGGHLVLHVHNRRFYPIALRTLRSGDIAMSQAYGGAKLSLYHYTRREAISLLKRTGFDVQNISPIGVRSTSGLSRPWLLPRLRAYGYLIAARKRTA